MSKEQKALEKLNEISHQTTRLISRIRVEIFYKNDNLLRTCTNIYPRVFINTILEYIIDLRKILHRRWNIIYERELKENELDKIQGFIKRLINQYYKWKEIFPQLPILIYDPYYVIKNKNEILKTPGIFKQYPHLNNARLNYRLCITTNLTDEEKIEYNTKELFEHYNNNRVKVIEQIKNNKKIDIINIEEKDPKLKDYDQNKEYTGFNEDISIFDDTDQLEDDNNKTTLIKNNIFKRNIS